VESGQGKGKKGGAGQSFGGGEIPPRQILCRIGTKGIENHEIRNGQRDVLASWDSERGRGPEIPLFGEKPLKTENQIRREVRGLKDRSGGVVRRAGRRVCSNEGRRSYTTGLKRPEPGNKPKNDHRFQPAGKERSA